MSKIFGLVENIDTNCPDSWKNKIFLTFDVDWAIDEVWIETIKVLEDFNIPATWFVTHNSKLISRIHQNPNFRIGIHPNFNQLLEQNNQSKTVDEILDDLISFVPNSSIIRSHSLFQSEKMLDIFHKKGFNIICNNFIPLNSFGKISPYSLWDDIIIAPHCWQDNVSLKMKLNLPESLDQLIILNFHPIHIFLNTDDLKLYESSKDYNKNIHQLKSFVNKDFGIRTILIDLIKRFS